MFYHKLVLINEYPYVYKFVRVEVTSTTQFTSVKENHSKITKIMSPKHVIPSGFGHKMMNKNIVKKKIERWKDLIYEKVHLYYAIFTGSYKQFWFEYEIDDQLVVCTSHIPKTRNYELEKYEYTMDFDVINDPESRLEFMKRIMLTFKSKKNELHISEDGHLYNSSGIIYEFPDYY
jgi:hypothetical protein